MTADLPPEVEDKAERAASVAYAVAMNHGYNNPFRGVVDAVAEVLAAEVEVLRVRLTEEKTKNLHLGLELEARDDAQWDLHQRLLPELAEAKEENRRLHDVVHRERPSVGDMVIELPKLRAQLQATAGVVSAAKPLSAWWKQQSDEDKNNTSADVADMMDVLAKAVKEAGSE